MKSVSMQKLAALHKAGKIPTDVYQEIRVESTRLLSLSRDTTKRMRQALMDDGQCTLKRLSSGKVEIVAKKYVTIAPRRHFEKKHSKEAPNA